MFKIIYKNGKNNHKLWWYWNPKTKISSTWRTYFNKIVDIDKIAVSNKFRFGKKGDLNILLVTKMLKKLSFYVYFSQKWLHIERFWWN